jgi:CRISPR-associated protein Cmr4
MSDTSLLFIHALTGLHPGSGSALGVVDLPIQRERHTDWPIIPGSSLKGVLRSSSTRITGEAKDGHLLAAFGSETSGQDGHAGALSFSDARILAFPVRSLAGVFAWVTCPAVLTRLKRDLELRGERFTAYPEPARGKLACASGSPLLASDDKVLLEEFEFAHADDSKDVAEWISNRAVRDSGTATRIKTHLAVLHDDDFSHFVRHATEVVARVGLDYENKTVRKGALFYEEFLPTETLMYSVVNSTGSRRTANPMGAADIMHWLRSNAPDLIQIGGSETVGRGMCAVRFTDLSGEAA